MKRTLVMLLFMGFLAGCGDDDSSPDAAVPDAGGCVACSPTQVCVQIFDRSCGGSQARVHCVNSPLVCPASTCTPECERAICGLVDGGTGPTCQARILCGGEDRNAFTCYQR